MISRYISLGIFTVRITLRKATYEGKKLEDTVQDGLDIVKQESLASNTQHIQYYLVKNKEGMFSIEGHLIDQTVFQIDGITNLTKDKRNGFRYLSRVRHVIERDLREIGVTTVSTNSLAKLSPIAVKRYGFYDARGRDYKTLQGSWRRFIPWKADRLRRDL